MSKSMTSSPISEILTDLAAGRLVLVFDDNPGRELEADLVGAASLITPEQIRFMAHFGGGIICVPLTGERLDALQIPNMVRNNHDPLGTAWTVSVDALGTGTGISAFDRTTTIHRLIDPQAVSTDFIQPGHVFPLRARAGGVLERPGHTESSVDLMRLAGLEPAAVICEIMLPTGYMAREPETLEFARAHNLKMCRISEIIAAVKNVPTVKTLVYSN